MDGPGLAQLPLGVQAVEEVPEEHLVLEDGLPVEHEGERPLHHVLETERLQPRQLLGSPRRAPDRARREGLGTDGLRLNGDDLAQLGDEVAAGERHPEVLLVRIQIHQAGVEG